MTTRATGVCCARFHPSHPSFVTLILSSSRPSIGCSRCSPPARTPRVDASASRIAMRNDAVGFLDTPALALRACTIYASSPSIRIRRADRLVRATRSSSTKAPIFDSNQRSRDRGGRSEASISRDPETR